MLHKNCVIPSSLFLLDSFGPVFLRKRKLVLEFRKKRVHNFTFHTKQPCVFCVDLVHGHPRFWMKTHHSAVFREQFAPCVDNENLTEILKLRFSCDWSCCALLCQRRLYEPSKALNSSSLFASVPFSLLKRRNTNLVGKLFKCAMCVFCNLSGKHLLWA